MTTWGEKLGAGGRNIGVGVSVPPVSVEDPFDILYDSFKAGYVSADAQEDIPKDAFRGMSGDVRPTKGDGIRNIEGLIVTDVLGDNVEMADDGRYLFQHASLDFSTELIVVHPPYIMRKTGATDFVRDNLGIVATGEKGWRVANIAGNLLITNGTTATYVREPGAATVTDISADIIADTFATSFGRVFAGAFTDPISGYQGLGIRWNGTGSPPEDDWASANAGAELLLANQLEADRIIALRAIGFDALAVLTRKAVWMGYQTGQDNHPAQFRLRFPAAGCVSEPSAVASPDGVTYLSDNGVLKVNLNEVQNISSQINDILLPLDYSQLQSYRAAYDPVENRYILITPTMIWYYDYPQPDRPGRWYRRLLAPALAVVIYTEQSGDVNWATVQGSWASQTRTWAEMVVGELDAQPRVYFAYGNSLIKEDPDTFWMFSTDVLPKANIVVRQDLPVKESIVECLEVELEWISQEDSTIRLVLGAGNLAYFNGMQPVTFTEDLPMKVITLPNTYGNVRSGVVTFGAIVAGDQDVVPGVPAYGPASPGTALQIIYLSGTAEIRRIRQRCVSRGRVQQVLG